MKIVSLLRRLRSRSAAAEALQFLAFAAVVAGVYRIAGIGVALVVAGVLGVVLAYEVDA